MKPTNQVRKNHSASPSKRQAQTLPEKSVTGIFYSIEDDSELARVDFPKKTFDVIKCASKELGISFSKFFNLAILHKLENDGIEVPAHLIAGGAR